jgi:hypothetical protein
MYEDNFIDLCVNGEMQPGDIDKYVDLWHTIETYLELHEFLGMSEDEYESWVNDDSYLSVILEDRKKNKK